MNAKPPWAAGTCIHNKGNRKGLRQKTGKMHSDDITQSLAETCPAHPTPEPTSNTVFLARKVLHRARVLWT